jgi:hypothetical protein
MIKEILEKSGLKNELGPYEILDIGGGGLKGKNTTNDLLEYFDIKKHSITIQHWSEWETDKGTDYCKNIDDITEIDADFYSYDYGEKKFDLIVIDMPSKLNMRDWEEDLLKNKIFDLLNEDGHVINYVLNGTEYITIRNNNNSLRVIEQTNNQYVKNYDVDLPKILEVIIDKKNDIVDGSGNVLTTAEQLLEDIDDYRERSTALSNHFAVYWDVNVIGSIKECMNDVPFKTNYDLNHDILDESIDHTIKRRIDAWYYYCNLQIPTEMIKDFLIKEMSNHYIVKNVLDDGDRNYITWVDLEKNKEI